MNYLNQFLESKCAPDVLGAVGKINKPAKEITEAMSIMSAIRSLTLKFPMQYTVVDLCAGNCLTGILIAHLLPVKQVIAVDKKSKTKARYGSVKRWTYVQADIKNKWADWYNIEDNPTIFVASHACGSLSNHIIYGARCITNKADENVAPQIAIMPCCIEPVDAAREQVQLSFIKMSKYEAWCLSLIRYCWGMGLHEAHGYRDRQVLSPCNVIITNIK